MRQIIVPILAAVLLFGLCGCQAQTPAEPESFPLDVEFDAQALRDTPAPVLEEERIVVRTIPEGDLTFSIYQRAGKDSPYYAAVSVDGTAYDLGCMAYPYASMDRPVEYIRRTEIAGEETVYKMIQIEDITTLYTTYFTVEEGGPRLLCQLTGAAREYDVDGDGEVETVSNGGFSTWPNYILYEWDLEADRLLMADMRRQLACEMVAFDDEALCFIASTDVSEDPSRRVWSNALYAYQGGQLVETDGAGGVETVEVSYENFQMLSIDGTRIGLASGPAKGNCFCTPMGARVIGWDHSIHYCFIPGYGEQVFSVNPDAAGKKVRPLSRNFTDFLRLILSCGHTAAIEQIAGWTEAEFAEYLEEEVRVTAEERAVLTTLEKTFGLKPMEEPFRYVKEVQADFDPGRLRFTNAYYDTLGLPRPEGSGNAADLPTVSIIVMPEQT